MTTIAFDGETLAADRMWTFGGLKFEQSKLHVCKWKGRAFAFAKIGEVEPMIERMAASLGTLGDAEYLSKDWAEGFELSDEQAVQAIMLLGGSPYFMVRSKFLALPTSFVAPNGKSVFALGSGAFIAIGAMMAGAPAVQAIEITAKCHDGTGMGVDSVSVRELIAL